MSKSIITLLLSAFLLGHCFIFVPARPSTDQILDESLNEVSEESSENLTPRLQLLKFTTLKFCEVCNVTVIAGKDVLKKVTRDWRVLLRSNGIIENGLDEMRDFISKAQKTETSDEIEEMIRPCELWTELVDILEKYDTTEVQNPTREIVLIEKALEKNGIKRVHDDFLKNFLNFIDVFESEFNIYINNLNEKEREEEQDLIKWFEKVKKGDDTIRKLEIFLKFFEDNFD